MLSLASLIFFTTCGGAFGLEPLVGATGAGRAIVLILITPLVWSLPISLMVAELAGLMPEEGGYYVWIRETLGRFWGVQAGWWAMAYAVGVMAIFPVLFVSYLSFFFPSLGTSADGAHPGMGALVRWLAAVLMVASAMAVNLRSAKDVGRTAKAGAAFVLGAFFVMILVWLGRSVDSAAVLGAVRNDFGAGHKGTLLLVLSILAFDYSGWDGASTYAGEVDEPQRNYPKAIAAALAVLVACYIFPVIAGLAVTTDPAVWSDTAGWPVIAQLIGGRWLGGLLAAAGLVSMWGLFNAQLLYASRLPYVMARDGWLPKVLARASPKTAVPTVATIAFCAITGLFSALSFGGLAVIQSLMYATLVMLELLALVGSRLRRPEARPNFRVPGGWGGLAYVCVAPLASAMLLLFAVMRNWRAYWWNLMVVGLVVASGVSLYWARRGAGGDLEASGG
jgi:amino acid transporter